MRNASAAPLPQRNAEHPPRRMRLASSTPSSACAVRVVCCTWRQVRGSFIAMALLGFVATGVFRGFKDTRTPLVSAAISATASLSLNVLFIYGERRGAQPPMHACVHALS